MTRNTVTDTEVARIEELMGDLLDERDGIRLDYVGRGYSRQPCLGIVTDATGMALYAVARAKMERTADEDLLSPEDPDRLDLLDEVICDLSNRSRVDSMGRSRIIYWPSIAHQEADGE